MKKRNYLAVLASLAVMTSMFSISANAANYPEDKKAQGGTSDFSKYLVLDNGANVPNATFKYSIAAGTAIEGTENEMQVYAGIIAKDESENVTAPVVSDAVFQAADTTKAGAVDDGITNSADKKYAQKTITANFAGIKFDEPGVYRYVVTEDLNGSQGVTNVGSITKTLDVFVIDKNGTLEVESYVLYNKVIDTAPSKNTSVEIAADKTAEDGKKTDGFVNDYDTHDLTFSKTVTGNQGSKDKYFKFDVTISNAVAGTVYTVDLSNADATVASNSATKSDYIGKTNPSTITVPDDNTTVTETFYLQHGQYITIFGLANDTVYSVTENAEDYTSSEGILEAYSTLNWDNNDGYDALTDAVSGTINGADIHTGYTNDRSGTIPTGVILSVAAPVVIGLAVLGGIVFLVIRNKKRESEEEE